jgi:hypothetical protein
MPCCGGHPFPHLRNEVSDHYGGLRLAGATAAATYGRAQTATLLAKASTVAERLGINANMMGTAFGPVNVAIPHDLDIPAVWGCADSSRDR